MKLRNTTGQNCCIMLWYEERKQVDKMESKMKCYVAFNMLNQAIELKHKLDVKHKVNK